jgi:glycosyltransferase involved in cell wall biosynthesis
LVRSLEGSYYEPVILFHGPNAYRERFQTLGAQVLTLSEEAPAMPVTTSRRDIAASLSRYSDSLAETYRVAKQIYLVARQDWPLARRVAGLIKAEAVDLVHHNNDLSTNRATILAALLAGVPQICHVRMLDRFSYVERFLARFVDAFIYMSTAIEELYQSLGVAPQKGYVVYDAFDSKAFEQDNHTAELRSELGVTDRDQLVCNVGRLDWWKGQDHFLKAMAKVVASRPNAKALLVGAPDASPLSQAFFHKLEQMIADLQLEEHVVLTGFRSDVPALMLASDIVVHSSSEPEPFGRVVVEAMLAGRPVVATAAGGVLDIVEDQVTGLLVPPQDATNMAQAIEQLLQNQERAKIMGQRAQQSATQRFSRKQHAAGIDRIYRQVLSSKKGPTMED